MSDHRTVLFVKNLIAVKLVNGIFLMAFVVSLFIHRADTQTHHIPMRRPMCNSLIREVPAAILEGVGGYKMGIGLCDVTLTAPDKAKWMVKIDKAAINDCDVYVQIFESHVISLDGKSLVRIGCASTDPGIVYINSSSITIRLKHNNSSDYSFIIIATALQKSSKPDMHCRGFKCGTGACVAKSLICDAIDNCFDYSDESPNGTAHCDAGYWRYQGENWGLLASILGAVAVFGITAACCRHIRNKSRGAVDDLYELNEGPYVHKYAYRYASIRAPKKPNQTNVVLGRDGHMHYTTVTV